MKTQAITDYSFSVQDVFSDEQMIMLNRFYKMDTQKHKYPFSKDHFYRFVWYLTDLVGDFGFGNLWSQKLDTPLYHFATELLWDTPGYFNPIHIDDTKNQYVTLHVFLEDCCSPLGSWCGSYVPFKKNTGYLLVQAYKHSHGMVYPVPQDCYDRKSIMFVWSEQEQLHNDFSRDRLPVTNEHGVNKRMSKVRPGWFIGADGRRFDSNEASIYLDKFKSMQPGEAS